MPRKNLFTSILIIASFLFMLFPPVPVLAAPINSAWQDTTPDSEPVNPGWERMSPWYADAGETATSSLIQINYFSPSDSIKEIFSYNSETKKWQAWSSVDDRKTGMVSATVPTDQNVALFIKPDSLAFGTASWYRFKGGLFAASPDFPKGTKLKVTNLDNKKSVVITVNDYGPERDKLPNRVVDLDLVAFEKIAKKSAGLINVQVEPAALAVPATSASPAVSAVPTSTPAVPKNVAKPAVQAKTAIAVWEKTGKVAYEKSPNQQLPLASLSKIVAAKVFLDTKTSLDKVVTYKKADEDHNYEYCSPWQSAKLLVKDGETMTAKDLLYSALVGSANNAVESLVRASGLSREAFIARMNSTVKKWGATETKFVEPTGLSPDNMSSAHDYAIITKEALKDKNLQKIDTAKTYSFKTINTKKNA